MAYRSITRYNEAEHMKVGPFEVKQPLPSARINGLSPFVLLHHGGPQTHAPGALKSRLSPHPHRGFEPVTFIFNGKLHHKDSAGNEGFLEAGDVQWMTAGSGIIHSEGPSESFAKEGGEMEIIQLWVNLPRDHKMTPPKYQDIKKQSMPAIGSNGFTTRLVAGSYGDHKGPASTFSPILAMMSWFEEGAVADIDLPASFNALVYVLDGRIESGSTILDRFEMGVAEKDGSGVRLKALSAGKLLLVAGEPINEPVVSYGPFVMNYPGEIRQAILDYETGRMGVLES